MIPITPTPLDTKIRILAEMIDYPPLADYVNATNHIALQVVNNEIPLTDELADLFESDFYGICEHENTDDIGFASAEDFYLSCNYNPDEE
jgi:hypothetical protein